MTKPLCVLCGEPLDNGKPTNREHYVPQVAIRNFKKLGVPSHWTHALRIDLRKEEGEATLAPISAHKEWATVRTHTKCNTDASHMCQDMKRIIDSLDKEWPDHWANSIIEYYAHLWSVDVHNVSLHVYTQEEIDHIVKNDGARIYCAGQLWIGRLMVSVDGVTANGYEEHSIFLGKKKELEKVIG